MDQWEHVKKSRISKQIFCFIPNTSDILKYYGYAHESWILMMHWRKKSREIWIKNKEKWREYLRHQILVINKFDFLDKDLLLLRSKSKIKDFFIVKDRELYQESHARETHDSIILAKKKFGKNKIEGAIHFLWMLSNTVIPEFFYGDASIEINEEYYLFLFSRYSTILINWARISSKYSENAIKFIKSNAKNMKRLDVISVKIRWNLEI